MDKEYLIKLEKRYVGKDLELICEFDDLLDVYFSSDDSFEHINAYGEMNAMYLNALKFLGENHPVTCYMKDNMVFIDNF